MKNIILIILMSLSCNANSSHQVKGVSSGTANIKYYAMFNPDMDSAQGVFFHAPSIGSSISLAFDHGSQWKQHSPHRFIVVDNFSRHRPEIYTVKLSDDSVRMYEISNLVYQNLDKIESKSEISVKIKEVSKKFVLLSLIVRTSEKDYKKSIKIDIAEINKIEEVDNFLDIKSVPVLAPHDLLTEKKVSDD